MKRPSITALNSLGFKNDAQRLYVAANLLSIGVYPQKDQIIYPASGTIPQLRIPAINPLPPFAGAIDVEWIKSESTYLVKAKMPYNHARVTINDQIETDKDFYEFTLPTLQINQWGFQVASDKPETKVTTDEPLTLEAYFVKYADSVASNIDASGTVKAKSYVTQKFGFLTDPKGIKIPVKEYELLLAVDPSGTRTLDSIGMYA
jgi:hypothetical protein